MTRLIAAVFALAASCGSVVAGISFEEEIPAFTTLWGHTPQNHCKPPLSASRDANIDLMGIFDCKTTRKYGIILMY